MRIIKKWQSKLHEYSLHKELHQLKTNRQPKGYDEADSFGILFNATLSEDREVVKRYAQKLEKKGKKVKLFAFLNEEKKQDNFTFPHISRKELDWVLKPTDQQVKDFINTPFDFLINVYLEPNLTLEYISAFSKAHTRVGPFTDKEYCFDLMIETQEQHNLQHFIKQLEYYLSRMNSRKHEAVTV